jgi:hypothetical protein
MTLLNYEAVQRKHEIHGNSILGNNFFRTLILVFLPDNKSILIGL